MTALEIQHLSAQRDLLLTEIRDEELREMEEVSRCQHIARAADAEEKERRQDTLHELSTLKFAEDRLALSEQTAATRAVMFGLGPDPQALVAEMHATRQELGSARNARAVLVTARAAAERQTLDECVAAIRAGSQENQALQANQQMARAHLKALEAMAASSFAQVSVREDVLYGLLRQLEEQESSTVELREHSEAVESRLAASAAELRQHEAAATASLWTPTRLARVEELELERARIQTEIQRLEREAEMMQDGSGCSRLHHGLEDELLEKNVAQLRNACAAARLQLFEASVKTPLLEREVARLHTELSQEQLVVAELEDIRSALDGASWRLRHSFDARVSEMEPDASALASAAGAPLTTEAEELTAQLDLKEQCCERLRGEAVERDKQFRSITRDLEEQIAVLQCEERASAVVAVPEWMSGAAGLGTAVVGVGVPISGVSEPPGPLVDRRPQQRSPPRRGNPPAQVCQDGAAAQDMAAPYRIMSVVGAGRLETGDAAIAVGATTLGASGRSASQPLLEPRSQALPQPARTRRSSSTLQGPSEATMGQLPMQNPYWLERGWFPASGSSAAAGQPPPARRSCEADAVAVAAELSPSVGPLVSPSEARRTIIHGHTGIGGPGGTGSESFLGTPTPGPPQRASPMALTQRRGGPTVPAEALCKICGNTGIDPFGRPCSCPHGHKAFESMTATASTRAEVDTSETLRSRSSAVADVRAARGASNAANTAADAGPLTLPAAGCPAATLARQAVAAQAAAAQAAAAAADGGSGQPPAPPRPLSIGTISHAENEVLGIASRRADANDRRAAFQARIAELKGAIGASLRSLDEEEAADTLRARSASLNARANGGHVAACRGSLRGGTRAQ